ncbi:TonB-dependent Receptor Plug Domain protein [Tsuneonella dongtanensis]|uniref:TonB-dependent Receptor Plug Domain protein n=1 Tax=Tsuneonella dongtanensis TaxID=692370 RepID=A0A1B2AGX1_9SPHN|nr:TonB-dependent receptor [Tsuneonella dongtanensis]ANY21389.1 TonB-dependent Receptor Plug Domain protein [Tsuneonella dongtanensis]
MIRRHRSSTAARRLLALSTASGLALLAAQPVWAQDAAEEPAAEDAETDEDDGIVVTGFRASLQNAQNIKENADTFVDVITAEDIGALPDRSVAEALQRVPGVNIGRFEKTSDPDRFSVEGTGVIIRGLPFVRSELNGRDIFSANGGRSLSFEDVSPELLGRVEVFKNVTADMIDGGIAGTVNLVTRKPLDKRGFNLAGSVEANYGDLQKDWTGGFSILGSNTFETDGGTIGVQLGYTTSKLKTRTDATQLTDPCYRARTLDGPCVRVSPTSSAGVGAPVFDASNFPPANTVVAPKGAGVRTTDLTRDREAWSAALQYEDPTGDFLMTFEWLRSETKFFTDEYAILALVNDDALFPVPRPGTTWQFDENGIFQSGVLTQRPGDAYANPFGRGGIGMESLRFQRGARSVTEDFSFDATWQASDRLRFNFEAQRIKSDLSRNSIIGAMNTWADVSIDATGKTPQIEFLAPQGSPSDYFSSGFYTYYWFLLDSIERNDGELDSLRFDAEYDVSDTGFIKSVRVGGRWSDRERTTRDTAFSTWGNLSAPWAGRAGCAPWNSGPNCPFQPGRFFTGLPGQEGAIGGGAYISDFPNFSQVRNPFADNFQRGNAPTPIPNGAAYFFGGDDFLGEYLSGTSKSQAQAINVFSQTPNPFFGVDGRGPTCTPFCPSEINSVREVTKAAYARVDFGTEFGGGTKLDGNIGLRYVRTRVPTQGLIGFPSPLFFDTAPGGNRDGRVQVAEVADACTRVPPGQTLPGYCGLTPARLQEFVAAFTGETLVDDRDIEFEHWLPSFNAKLDFGGGWLARVAVSKGITRPELNLFGSGGSISDNTNDLRAEGTLANGPLFQIFSGNRNVRPISSWNYDASVEWYFARVGSLTASLFLKEIKGIPSNGAELRSYTSPNGTTVVTEFNGPLNSAGGTLKGVELAYQQTYDFLPGLLSGLGSQLTYTYVDGGDFVNTQTGGGQRSSFAAQQPLAGISKHTVNAVLFYEKGPISARAAYNWRSDFLITPRDDIFPFSPIWQESGGQLDASLFYTVNDNLKVGVQGVNLLDQVTRTSQVIDFDGNRVTRSAFRNDRRYTFLARFNF